MRGSAGCGAFRDDRDGAVRVVDQRGADRSKQGAAPGVLAAVTDHHHFSEFGQLYKRRRGRRDNHLSVDLGAIAAYCMIFSDLGGAGEQLPGAMVQLF